MILVVSLKGFTTDATALKFMRIVLDTLSASDVVVASLFQVIGSLANDPSTQTSFAFHRHWRAALEYKVIYKKTC